MDTPDKMDAIAHVENRRPCCHVEKVVDYMLNAKRFFEDYSKRSQRLNLIRALAERFKPEQFTNKTIEKFVDKSRLPPVHADEYLVQAIDATVRTRATLEELECLSHDQFRLLMAKLKSMVKPKSHNLNRYILWLVRQNGSFLFKYKEALRLDFRTASKRSSDHLISHLGKHGFKDKPQDAVGTWVELGGFMMVQGDLAKALEYFQKAKTVLDAGQDAQKIPSENALDRWNREAVEFLPHFIKLCLSILKSPSFDIVPEDLQPFKHENICNQASLERSCINRIETNLREVDPGNTKSWEDYIIERDDCQRAMAVCLARAGDAQTRAELSWSKSIIEMDEKDRFNPSVYHQIESSLVSASDQGSLQIENPTQILEISAVVENRLGDALKGATKSKFNNWVELAQKELEVEQMDSSISDQQETISQEELKFISNLPFRSTLSTSESLQSSLHTSVLKAFNGDVDDNKKKRRRELALEYCLHKADRVKRRKLDTNPWSVNEEIWQLAAKGFIKSDSSEGAFLLWELETLAKRIPKMDRTKQLKEFQLLKERFSASALQVIIPALFSSGFLGVSRILENITVMEKDSVGKKWLNFAKSLGNVLEEADRWVRTPVGTARPAAEIHGYAKNVRSLLNLAKLIASPTDDIRSSIRKDETVSRKDLDFFHRLVTLPEICEDVSSLFAGLVSVLQKTEKRESSNNRWNEHTILKRHLWSPLFAYSKFDSIPPDWVKTQGSHVIYGLLELFLRITRERLQMDLVKKNPVPERKSSLKKSPRVVLYCMLADLYLAVGRPYEGIRAVLNSDLPKSGDSNNSLSSTLPGWMFHKSVLKRLALLWRHTDHPFIAVLFLQFAVSSQSEFLRADTYPVDILYEMAKGRVVPAEEHVRLVGDLVLVQLIYQILGPALKAVEGRGLEPLHDLVKSGTLGLPRAVHQRRLARYLSNDAIHLFQNDI